MCQTEAIGRDLSLMKRLSEETRSLPLCRCRISPILMSLQTPGTTYHPLTASIYLRLLLPLHFFPFFSFFFVFSAPPSISSHFLWFFLFLSVSLFTSIWSVFRFKLCKKYSLLKVWVFLPYRV